MRSDAVEVVEGRTDKYRAALLELAADCGIARAQVRAILPFALVPKRPRGPEGKVKIGVYQSYRRYRPLVLTEDELLVFDSGRTPHPRELLGRFPLRAVRAVDV